MKYLSTLLLITFYGLAWSQANQGIGTWKSYLPYKYGLSLTQSPDAIFYGTQWALLKINKEDLSLE